MASIFKSYETTLIIRLALNGPRIYNRGRNRCLQSIAKQEKIQRVLIANRGEIALRVMRTAKQLGIETVAIYSDADVNSLHVQTANQAYRIGGPSPVESYLCAEKIIDVALRANVDAIHPGYGFLSENAAFAESCDQANIIFIGPPSQAIRTMGMKNAAKLAMIKANVPVIQGYNGTDQSNERLFEEARHIGFPIMMKAVFGGGGKGMRISWSEGDFEEKLNSARSEAKKAYNNTDMIVEKYVESPRHIEVQIFGDKHSNYVYLWERDCSIQRRHQKIIEEAPANGISEEVRRRIGRDAVEAARAVNYIGAGTVEFIMDVDENFYFMEMNTRLQVEHPVTEEVTGLDLVHWQFHVANGEKLPLMQDEIPLIGHAIEARIYAEDTQSGFLPTPGLIEYLKFPTSSRVESGIKEGDAITIYYDSMIAKIISTGSTRAEAIKKLDNALAQTHIGGIYNNVNFVRRCLRHPKFVDGNLSTGFIEENEKVLIEDANELDNETYVEGALARILLQSFSTGTISPSDALYFFRVNHYFTQSITIDSKTQAFVEIDSEKGVYKIHRFEINGCSKALQRNYRLGLCQKEHLATKSPCLNFLIEELDEVCENVMRRWNCKAVQLSDCIMVFGLHGEQRWDSPFNNGTPAYVKMALEHSNEVLSPMPGIVEKTFVSKGDCVHKDQALLTINAMKMEFVIKAPFDSTVGSLHCATGENVRKNDLLITFEPTLSPPIPAT